MEFTLNGEVQNFDGDENLSLLKFLRNIEGITTPKDGCSGQGVCGACAVDIDGKSLQACVTTMKRIAGKKITTVEGMNSEWQDVFALAFVEKGGIQCGFCTPGIVISAKCLLEKNPNPSRKEVKDAINKHLCRCTGYKKVIDSILYAAAILRGEVTPEEQFYSGKVGTRLPKYDAYYTVLGMRPFTGDLSFPGMLHAALKFSDHPRAKVLSLDLTDALAVPGVSRIVTAKDIPGKRYIGLIEQDWPLMIDVGEITNYIGDVLAAVVADTEEIARAALAKIEVQYEVLTPVTTVDDAMKVNATCVHPNRKNNILSLTSVARGDMSEARKKTKYISKGNYYTQRIEHAFLEPECAVAMPSESGDGLVVYSQGQGAYEDRKQISKVTGLPLEKVQVIQVQNGGAFGGKEDLTVQGHAGLLALLTGAPVRVALSRVESMNMHPKRHPMRLRYEVGCDARGKLTYLKARIDGDSGAYASVGAKVLERAAGHAAGAYDIGVVEIVATSVYTNNVPCGAMRGFGVNQTAFAMESCIDELCEKGKFDRWQFRYDNALDVGSTLTTGQVIKGGIGLKQTLELVKDKFYQAPYAGIACGIKNTGIGNGKPDIGVAKIVIEAADQVVIHHGWTEMGQGVHTMAIHTVCEETGLDPSIMEVRVDTKEDVVCGMTTSSRGTSLVGHSLIEACKKLKKDLKKKKLKDLVGKVYHGSWMCDWTTDPADQNPEIEQITHYSYSYATQVVTLNEKGKISKIYCALDCGRIMNPTLFEGQTEGAMHMGLGYALTENFPMKDGFPLIKNFGKVGLIRAKDMPPVEVLGVEARDPHGPFGAKGVGEIGIVPTAAAVACALYQYDKIRRYSLPIGYKK